jgi:hypothetical protein
VHWYIGVGASDAERVSVAIFRVIKEEREIFKFFWNMTQCGLIYKYNCFGEVCYILLEGS